MRIRVLSILLSLWPLFLLLPIAVAQECQIELPSSPSLSPSLSPSPSLHNETTQREYILGGHSWHLPVIDYLNDVVGQQFDPPIRFTWKTHAEWLNAPTVEDALARGYDFINSNAYRSSCYESEGKAIALATERRVLRDPDTRLLYNVTQFGAALYTLSNRTDILTVQDVRGKKIGTNRYSNLATHLCYDVLLRNGVHNLQDPEQIIYFRRSTDALEAVLDGRVDVGCAAANTLEFYKVDDDSERLDLSRIRILGEQLHMTNDGVPYPFKVSSPLVPTPLFQALPHVEPIVIEKVRNALLAMGDHADVAPALLACLDDRGCQTNNTVCAEDCFQSLTNNNATMIRRCDTTAELALKAFTAIGDDIWGYTKPQQNLDMRDIQESTGFLVRDPNPRCVRLQNIAEAVTCPPGHFIRSSQDIINECNVSGLECYGWDCLCSPCVKAFEVDFVVTSNNNEETTTTQSSSITGTGCSKFSLCGAVEQESSISLLAVDNKKRHNITMRGAFLMSDDSRDEFVLDLVNGTFQYDFDVSRTRVGQKVVIIEVCERDEPCGEIPESPFRINVMKRSCPAELFGNGREADEWGVCVCKGGMVDLGRNCSSIAAITVVAVVLMMFVTLVTVMIYVRKLKDETQNDMLWTVKHDELKFNAPPEIVGRGTFGLVLLAEYRGTQVAVKRVIPAKTRATLESSFHQDKTEPTGIESSEQLNQSQNLGLRSGFSGARSNEDAEIGAKASWEKLRSNFVEEMRILSKLRHPCICTVMGAVIDNKDEPMLVMEYMDYGSLHDLLKNNTMAINGEVILPILRDISQGVRFLHSADPQVIHGDLKAANILVDSHFRAKVADFGLSQKKQLRGTGTPYWMAPELLRNESAQTAASDVFSFGVILIEVCSRKDPYEGEDPNTVLKEIADKSIQKRPTVPASCTSQIQSMIADCLVDEADSRPTFEEIDTRLKRIDTAAADILPMAKNKTLKRPGTDVGLQDSFPSHIAEALQGGRKIEPEHRDCVTIFFSDVVDFDKISPKLPSHKVADLLDRLHSKFDALAKDHDVFKVETIGDTYMAVTNLVKDQRDSHAKRIADFSIAAIAAGKTTFIDKDDESKGFVSIRCGFHSGPVVADVVGIKCPRYCLFGEAVNMASLMESKSLANRIQCSVASVKLLKQQDASIKISSRGMIPIKGKGVMDTFWVDESSNVHTPFTVTRQELDDVWSAGAFSSIETA
ncbi:unnamed protein product [Cylindrotheca closterium]|uniref:Guanylate cyclase n=1 Tax=Cylindrotheca closterium TaxID=2856 RepID=A0AAD2G773_9STRA|nr:unnamed protein product [Cylindrotheca closterium]